ncbi:hypothetical protein P7C70_g7768, partial [Phenoliferia sp. Uapishka_3]
MSSHLPVDEQKKKQRRNRKAASCEVIPCQSCVSKNEEDKCIWSSTSVPPLITARDRGETEHLRTEVNRLQALIDVLSSRDGGLDLGALPSYSPSAHSTNSRFSGPSPEAPAIDDFAEAPKDEDLAAHDLAQQLGQLTIKQFLDGQQPGGDLGPDNLLTELRPALFQLQLHRDPSKSKVRYSVAEAEDRRRLFWLTFVADQFASTVTGRRFTMLHLRDIDTRVPLDIPDEKMGLLDYSGHVETDMTSLICRIRIAQLAEKISDDCFGIQAVSYSTVCELDRQVNELEASMPTIYKYEQPRSHDLRQPIPTLRTFMIQLGFCSEKLRLHRPYQTRSYIDETYNYSREVCIATSHRILEIHASPLCEAAWAGLNYKAVCASIVLSIDLLRLPDGPQASHHRRAISDALIRIERYSKISTSCRRGSKVIRFLLERDRESLRSEPVQKRSRNNSSTGSLRERSSSTGGELHHKSQSASPLPHPLPSPSVPSTVSPASWDLVTEMFGASADGSLPPDLASYDFAALLGFDPLSSSAAPAQTEHPARPEVSSPYFQPTPHRQPNVPNIPGVHDSSSSYFAYAPLDFYSNNPSPSPSSFGFSPPLSRVSARLPATSFTQPSHIGTFAERTHGATAFAPIANPLDGSDTPYNFGDNQDVPFSFYSDLS